MNTSASQKKRRKWNKAVNNLFGPDVFTVKKTKPKTVSQDKESNNVTSDIQYDSLSWEDFFDFSEDFHDDFSEDFLDELSASEASDSEHYSDDDSNVKIVAEESFTRQISEWLATSNCSREKSNELLGILRTSGGHTNLPKDIRTLIHTPRDVSSVLKCGGQYIYSGIMKGIIESFSINPKLQESEVLMLDVNIDGLPLCKSSKSQLWPIIGSINSSDYVFTIATFHANSKPTSVDEFLLDFITEANKYIDNNISIKSRKYKFQIRAIICDAPARSFLKCIIGHTGYFSCERCQNKGEIVQRRIVYNKIEENLLRTGKNFSEMSYSPIHQKARSPLIDLHNFDCVSQVPLDYMHLVLLGVVKRMVTYLMKGPKVCRISNAQICEISDRLVSFSGQMPSEFNRQPRSLKDFKYWKATELRQLLLYTGPIVFRSILPKSFYQHFLALNVAMSILLSESLIKNAEMIDYAESFC